MTKDNNHGAVGSVHGQPTITTTSNDLTLVQMAVLQFLKTVTPLTGCTVMDIRKQFGENEIK